MISKRRQVLQEKRSDPEWRTARHALEYLERADTIPHRTEGEAELLAWLPRPLNRVLDLGSGNGRLLGLVRAAHPEAQGVALDFSTTMLGELERRFDDDVSVSTFAHDLEQPLPESLGMFEAVVSSFAIHHLPHARKRALYEEIFTLLRPGGIFANLEHVSSPTPRLHESFLALLKVTPETEDPSNRLLDVETQLAWLREIGYVDVDCHWKWRELALLAGLKPRR